MNHTNHAFEHAQLQFCTISQYGHSRRCGGEGSASACSEQVQVLLAAVLLLIVVLIPYLQPKLAFPRRPCLILFILFAFSNRDALPQTIAQTP